MRGEDIVDSLYEIKGVFFFVSFSLFARLCKRKKKRGFFLKIKKAPCGACGLFHR